MSFTKLKDRLNKLPLILAGPMVRRVEANSVSIWLALREARVVVLHVFDPTGDFESDPTPTLPIGEFLHMVVVTARPKPPQSLPDGEIRNYTVSFEPQGGGTKKDLFDAGIFAIKEGEAMKVLTYAGNPDRPSFMVPPASIDKLRILHTSCRKIDGDGVDAFPALDQVLDEALRNSKDKLRPAMLFLTGDQIYADGSMERLRDILFGIGGPEHRLPKILTDIGSGLMGVDEVLPVVEKIPQDLPSIRTFVHVDQAGFKNPNLFPVMGLGEFIALYLLTFSDVLWPEEHHEHDDFKRGLVATRRVFANLATYMIFDDHEVADSWYLTSSWAMPVFKSELGRRILQNALSAYALCQGWGNTPELYAGPQNPPGQMLLQALVDWRKAKFQAGSNPHRQIQRVLAIPDASTFETTAKFDLSHDVFHKPATDILPWHYTVPCKAIAINVLDVYTWKKYSTDPHEPGDHLPPRALDAQVSTIGNQPCALYVASNVIIHRHPRDGDPHSFLPSVKDFGVPAAKVGIIAAIVLTAAKLYKNVVFWAILGGLAGLLALSDIWLKFKMGVFFPPLGWLGRALRGVHYEEIGTEFEWHSAGFERLLDRLASVSAHNVNNQQFARVVLLSGDVHHSFAMRLSYFADFDPATGIPKRRASFAQLVSSPSKYVSESAESYDNRSSGEFAGWKRTSGNQAQEPKIKPGGAKVEWLGKGEFWVTKIQPTLPQFDEKENHRYSIEPIKPNVEPVQISTLPTQAPKTFDDFLSHLDLHQRTVLLKARHSDAVRANNVADVTFKVSGNQIKVRQDVWWWYSGIGSDPPAWFIRTFEVDMNTTNPPKMPGGP